MGHRASCSKFKLAIICRRSLTQWLHIFLFYKGPSPNCGQFRISLVDHYVICNLIGCFKMSACITRARGPIGQRSDGSPSQLFKVCSIRNFIRYFEPWQIFLSVWSSLCCVINPIVWILSSFFINNTLMRWPSPYLMLKSGLGWAWLRARTYNLGF